jgi:hypothetical protein
MITQITSDGVMAGMHWLYENNHEVFDLLLDHLNDIREDDMKEAEGSVEDVLKKMMK